LDHHDHGTNYLHALERFENPQASEPTPPIAVFGTPAMGADILIPIEPPVPTPKKHVAPFVERMSLRIRHLIRWEEMPTHLTAHLAYDVMKWLILGGVVVVVEQLAGGLLRHSPGCALDTHSKLARVVAVISSTPPAREATPH